MNSRTMAIQAACNKVGGRSDLAKLLNIKPQAVHKWLKGGRVSPENAMKIEKLTGVHKWRIRPDLWKRNGS